MALAQVEPDADEEQVPSPVGVPEVVGLEVEEALAATVEILADKCLKQSNTWCFWNEIKYFSCDQLTNSAPKDLHPGFINL